MALEESPPPPPPPAVAAAPLEEPPAPPLSPSSARRAVARARFRAAVSAVLRHLSGASALADKAAASDVTPDAAAAMLRRAASFGVSDPGCERPPEKHPHRPVFHIMPVRRACGAASVGG
jgi:hypothetical protein